MPCGAFDGGELIGYVLGWAGVDPEDGLHVHSHMLATLPDRRHRGRGLRAQARAARAVPGSGHRPWCAGRSIRCIARNAWLNLGKLGAVADRFRRELLRRDGDTINAGERSDRFVVAGTSSGSPDRRRDRSPPMPGSPCVRMARSRDPILDLDPPAGDVALREIPRERDLRVADPSSVGRGATRSPMPADACLGRGFVDVAVPANRPRTSSPASPGRRRDRPDRAAAGGAAAGAAVPHQLRRLDGEGLRPRPGRPTTPRAGASAWPTSTRATQRGVQRGRLAGAPGLPGARAAARPATSAATTSSRSSRSCAATRWRRPR